MLSSGPPPAANTVATSAPNNRRAANTSGRRVQRARITIFTFYLIPQSPAGFSRPGVSRMAAPQAPCC